MSGRELGEALLTQERRSPELETHYQKELLKMATRTLKWYERIAYGCGCVLGLFFCGLFSWVTWKSWGDLPGLATTGIALGAFFGLGFALVSLRILREGKLHILRDVGLFTGLTWVFMVLMMTLFLVLGQQMEDTDKGTQIILVGLVFFITFGVMGLLQYRIQQTETRVREAVLRVELQVAELAERLGLGTPSGSHGDP